MDRVSPDNIIRIIDHVAGIVVLFLVLWLLFSGRL